MSFLPVAIEAQLHREMYVAILNGLLEVKGSKQILARRANISTAYLSYILKLDSEVNSISVKTQILRTPSPKVAERICKAVDAPNETKQALLEHLLLANEKRHQIDRSIRTEILERGLAAVVTEIRTLHEGTIFAGSPVNRSSNYHVSSDLSNAILAKVSWQMDPLAFVDLCFVAHDAECVLNQPDAALWHAKVSRSIMNTIDPPRASDKLETFEYFLINSYRAEAVAYHNKRQSKQALKIYNQIMAMPALQRPNSFWKPHVLRDKINALSELSRFSITEVEYMADEARIFCEERNSEIDPLLLFLNTEALARAYLRHKNFKKCEKILSVELPRIETIPHLGALHKVLFFRTLGRMCWAVNDKYSGRYYMNEALNLATRADLEHQRIQIEFDIAGLRGD